MILLSGSSMLFWKSFATVSSTRYEEGRRCGTRAILQLTTFVHTPSFLFISSCHPLTIKVKVSFVQGNASKGSSILTGIITWSESKWPSSAASREEYSIYRDIPHLLIQAFSQGAIFLEKNTEARKSNVIL